MARKTSDAQLRASAKWDKSHSDKLSVKLNRGEGSRFKAYAEQQGKSVNALLAEYIRACIVDIPEQRTEKNGG